MQVAIGILAHPEILVLDEPFEGMDLANIRLMQTILHQLHEDGITIILSSHSLDFLDPFCDSLTFLNRGSAVLHGRLADLRQVLPWRRLTVRMRTPDAAERLGTWPLAVPWTLEAVSDPYTVQCRIAQADADHLPLANLWSLGEVVTVSLDWPSLTDVYWHVFGIPKVLGFERYAVEGP